MVFVTLEGGVHAFDGFQGTRKWSFDTGGELVESSLSSSVFQVDSTHDQHQNMIVPGVDGSIFSLKFGGTEATPKLQRLPVTAQDIVTQPFIVQSKLTAPASLSAPPHHPKIDPAMLVGDKSSKVFVVDLETGELKSGAGEEQCGPDDADTPTLLLTRTDFYVRAVNTKHGNEMWNASVGHVEMLKQGEILSDKSGEHAPPPKVQYNGMGEIAVFDREEGTLLWSVHLKEHPTSMHLFHGNSLVEEYYSFQNPGVSQGTVSPSAQGGTKNALQMRPTRSTLVDPTTSATGNTGANCNKWYLGSLTDSWNTVFAIPPVSMIHNYDTADRTRVKEGKDGKGDAVVPGPETALNNNFGFGVNVLEYQVVELEDEYTIVESDDPDTDGEVTMLKQSQNSIEIVPAKLSNYMLHGHYSNPQGVFRPRQQPHAGVALGQTPNVPSTVRVLQAGKRRRRILRRKGEQLSMFQTWRRRKLKSGSRDPAQGSIFSFLYQASGRERVRSTIVNEGILLSWRGVLYIVAFIAVVLSVSIYCVMKLYKTVRAKQEEQTVRLAEKGADASQAAKHKQGDAPEFPEPSPAPRATPDGGASSSGESSSSSSSSDSENSDGTDATKSRGSTTWSEPSATSTDKSSVLWTLDPKTMELRPSGSSSSTTLALPDPVHRQDSALSDELAAMVCKDRYSNDFEETKQLGRGGFGAVYACRNRLDGRQYAIKKIQLSSEKSWASRLDKVLREVKILARLEHTNIVRYFQAWLEEVDPEESFQCVYGKDAEKDSQFMSEYANTQTGADTVNGKPHPTKYDLILYIQMEYCTYTLGKYLSEIDRGNVDIEHTLNIVSQLAQGTAHVHTDGLIHRDLKPDNVFLQDNKYVKLGDFGLSREVEVDGGETEEGAALPGNGDVLTVDTSSPSRPSGGSRGFMKGKYTSSPMSSSPRSKARLASRKGVHNTMTSQIGTYIYASPEQISGGAYDAATDMFSLGMILFEMCHPPFSTGMERVMVLSNARDGQFAPYWKTFVVEYPGIGKLVNELLDMNPLKRPTAVEVVHTCNELLQLKVDVGSGVVKTVRAASDSSKELLEAENERLRALVAQYSPNTTARESKKRLESTMDAMSI